MLMIIGTSMLTHINKTGTNTWRRIIKETVPINSSLQLRNQYSQDETERKLMTEKNPRLRIILTGLPDFSTSSGNERLQAIKSRL
jgi:hypothetical protein